MYRRVGVTGHRAETSRQVESGGNIPGVPADTVRSAMTCSNQRFGVCVS